MIRDTACVACIVIIFLLLLSVVTSPGFPEWERKSAGRHYIEKGMEETESPNAVASIVWDYRGFDTLGEETVLFTALVGLFTIIVFGFKGRRK